MTGDALAAQCGKAAWYDLDGQTASGERSDGSVLAAAHRSLPFGTKVRVENLANGREVIVRVNDRGPFVGGRVIDVTRAAAEKLGMIKSGIANVRVTVVDSDERLDGCEDPSPRVITADAVAADGVKAKARPEEDEESQADSTAAAEPLDAQTAAVEEETAAVADGEAVPPEEPVAEKPAEPAPRKVLVATVLYDEGTDGAGEAEARRPRGGSAEAATFTEEPQTEDLEDAKIVATLVEIPLPRPRPPVFEDAVPTFNRTLALRFLDAFAPDHTGRGSTLPLGYAPSTPRGAVITE
ncbi:MAG TPA: septal ring lytic transglycosylase RlpA family protein [Bauldia sp.]|nr:septal ring lytic transglycosylase RlpA family protein [Bauldia sp.]